MASKVFGLGLTKTGTTSLAEALRILGYPTVHYPKGEVLLRQILSGDFNFEFLKTYDAATDTPIVRYYAQLDKMFPGSKFILTTREMESWLGACERHWAKRLRLDGVFDFHTLVDLSVYGCAQFNADRFRWVYDDHDRAVQSYFRDRSSDLLAINIVDGEGWELLCAFLNCPIPKVSFPHLHKSKVSR